MPEDMTSSFPPPMITLDYSNLFKISHIIILFFIYMRVINVPVFVSFSTKFCKLNNNNYLTNYCNQFNIYLHNNTYKIKLGLQSLLLYLSKLKKNWICLIFKKKN